jgi:hypothetical protein
MNVTLSIISIAVTANSLCGCADKQTAATNQIAEVVESARRANLMQQIDEKLNTVFKHIAAKDILIPDASDDISRIASVMREHLFFYFGIPENQYWETKVEDLIKAATVLYTLNDERFDGTDGQMYGSNRVLFLSAVEDISNSLLNRGFDEWFPYSGIFDFVRAAIQIVSDPFLEIDSSRDIKDAFVCASGLNLCMAKRNKLNEEVVNKIESVVLPEHLSKIYPKIGRWVFAPIYIVLNHPDIPLDVRRWVVDAFKAFVYTGEAVEWDKTAAVEFLNRTTEELRVTPEEFAMIEDIKRKIETLVGEV